MKNIKISLKNISNNARECYLKIIQDTLKYYQKSPKKSYRKNIKKSPERLFKTIKMTNSKISLQDKRNIRK